jgi:hypothetical protein
MKLGKCARDSVGNSVSYSVRDSVGSSIWLSIQTPRANKH